MNRDYRRKKLLEACKILKEEFSKDLNERNENRIEHASLLIDLYAQRHELPQDPTLDDDENNYFDYVPFSVDFFDDETILKYAENMIERLQKEEESRTYDFFEYRRGCGREENDDFSDPFVEKVKKEIREAILEYIEIGENLSVPDIIDYVTRLMKGQGDTEKFRKIINVAFRIVDDPGDSRCGNFYNEVFAKRLWNSLNPIQRRWLIKKEFITKKAVSRLEDSEKKVIDSKLLHEK